MSIKNKTSVETASDSPVAHQRLVRPCRCEFQKKNDWGYILFEWVGEPKYWRPYARHRRLPLAEAEKRARKYKHVLISCGGCGADVVREYGPNKAIHEQISQIAAKQISLEEPNAEDDAAITSPNG